MSRARSVQGLVEQQARWTNLRRLLEDRPLCETSGEHHWVSISRQMGSGGSLLARAIGERLGWSVLDREIVVEIARGMHRPEPVVAAHDERPSGPLDDYLSYLMVPGDPGQNRFLEEMVATIRSIAKTRNAVIVGRGANWFLESKCGLKLRIVAPVEHRVDLLAQRIGISRDEAVRRLHDADAEQRTFIRQAFGREIDDPLGYDLVVNLGSIPLDAATGVVLTALERKFVSA